MRRKWDPPRFVALLEEIRKATAATYEDLGRRSGVRPSTLSRWRQAQVVPDFDKVLTLALFARDACPDLKGAATELLRAAGFGLIDLDDYEPDVHAR